MWRPPAERWRWLGGRNRLAGSGLDLQLDLLASDYLPAALVGHLSLSLFVLTCRVRLCLCWRMGVSFTINDKCTTDWFCVLSLQFAHLFLLFAGKGF
ncbi:hypothetical protein BC826DRAFT_497748 [Russula brevipes]|nr:hypothetical protein BC826DRAFT_497748 [Russula brevipes]